jgi:hypothetical protein
MRRATRILAVDERAAPGSVGGCQKPSPKPCASPSKPPASPRQNLAAASKSPRATSTASSAATSRRPGTKPSSGRGRRSLGSMTKPLNGSSSPHTSTEHRQRSGNGSSGSRSKRAGSGRESQPTVGQLSRRLDRLEELIRCHRRTIIDLIYQPKKAPK